MNDTYEDDTRYTFSSYTHKIINVITSYSHGDLVYISDKYEPINYEYDPKDVYKTEQEALEVFVNRFKNNIAEITGIIKYLESELTQKKNSLEYYQKCLKGLINE